MTLNSSAGPTASSSGGHQSARSKHKSMATVGGSSTNSRDRDVTTSMSSDRHPTLPAAVTRVPEELLKSFSHTKRVGTYLLGRTIGEGSFAKVKEALHVITGELVRNYCIHVLVLF